MRVSGSVPDVEGHLSTATCDFKARKVVTSYWSEKGSHIILES